MPDIIFTSQEQHHINTIIDELDPEDHELLRPYYDMLPSDDWAFVCDYVRAKMRAVLETGMLIGSVADKARASKLVDGKCDSQQLRQSAVELQLLVSEGHRGDLRRSRGRPQGSASLCRR